MADVVVVGGGVAGLGSALALSRSGHEVVVLERDATPLPGSADEAFAWDRRGAPQVRHSHALLARLRNLLRDRYPDVLALLLDAGATEVRLTERLPPTIDDPAPRTGDHDLVMLACRRTTFEWVLRRVVLGLPHVRIADGVAVEGLAGLGGAVSGVRVGGHLQRADFVVAANGPRAPVPEWLRALGIDVPETVEDTGIVYLSRFYRLLDGADGSDQSGPIGGDLGYLKYATFLGDNRTFSVTFAVGDHDDVLRARLLDAEKFERAARCLPVTAPWVDPARAEPITPVHVMARLMNRLRRFVDDDGEPTVLGFHAVGDAHTCTNPLYGRGCSLAIVQAALLADAAATHPDDAAARARQYEAASAREVEPWYHAAVAQDRRSRADAAGDDLAAGDDEAAFMRTVMRDGLLPAMRTDATVLRAFIRTFNLLTPPDALLRDSDVIGRVLQVWQDRDNRPPEPVLGPPRDEMLAVLNA
jgi:2-polyprenyl-6-methoxyphenol hydroxylase-like FAD-dependent oxidoreductase